jgi:hypothetical protein
MDDLVKINSCLSAAGVTEVVAKLTKGLESRIAGGRRCDPDQFLEDVIETEKEDEESDDEDGEEKKEKASSPLFPPKPYA